MAGMGSIWAGRTGASLEVYLLGVVDLEAALLLQDRFLEELRQREDRQGVLLLCEHPPAVTVGREADARWLADSKTDLRNRDVPAVARVCLDLHVPAWTEADETGVWTRGGQVAEIGLAVQSGISTHGVFLEVAPWRDWVSRSRQRFTSRPRTSLAAQRLRPTPMGLVRETLIRHLAAHLDYARFHLYTSHPMLRRAQKVVAYA
jgi:lipoyl(octanoyl) transferase